MIATSGLLTALECTEFVFVRVSAQDQLGELTALPRLLSWFKGLCSKEEGKGTGREDEGPPRPFANCWICPCVASR